MQPNCIICIVIRIYGVHVILKLLYIIWNIMLIHDKRKMYKNVR